MVNAKNAHKDLLSARMKLQALIFVQNLAISLAVLAQIILVKLVKKDTIYNQVLAWQILLATLIANFAQVAHTNQV